MTKTQLTQLLSDKMNITKTQATMFFDLIVDVALEELSKTGSFVVPGMAKFIIKDSKDGGKRLSVTSVGELKKRLII